MDYDRLTAAAEHYTLPKAATHYRRLRDAAALAAARRRAMAARIAAKYGFGLIDVDPDGAAIAQLVRLLEKDL